MRGDDMLYPAQLYREELKRRLVAAWYDDKYKYYFSGSGYELNLPDNNETRHDFVHLDKDGNVDGYFSYQIDWHSKSLYNFGLIGFAKDNTMFLRDCVHDIMAMAKQGIRRAEFWAWKKNPANKFYERLIKKAPVGRIAGQLWQSGYFDGEYQDTVIYEIFFERRNEYVLGNT